MTSEEVAAEPGRHGCDVSLCPMRCACAGQRCFNDIVRDKDFLRKLAHWRCAWKMVAQEEFCSSSGLWHQGVRMPLCSYRTGISHLINRCPSFHSSIHTHCCHSLRRCCFLFLLRQCPFVTTRLPLVEECQQHQVRAHTSERGRTVVRR